MTLARALYGFALASGALACSNGPSMTSDAGMPSDGPSDGEAHPFLTALSVSSSDTGALAIALVPPFSPDVHDYYVRCPAGGTSLDVSMTASKGATTSLILPAPTSPSPRQTLTLDVSEGQAIVVAANAGSASTEYWVRCLPADFPPMRMDQHPKAGVPPAGYYLVGNSTAPGAEGYAIVLDGNGVPVWYIARRGGSGVDNIDEVARDTISLFSTLHIPAVEILHLDTSTTTSAAPNGAELDTHELRVLSNGDFLVISATVKQGVDLTGVKVRLPDGGNEPLGSSTTILDCHIIEFEPSGKVVWRWVGTEHFDPRTDTTAPESQATPDAGMVVDTFHCNSIDVDPANGNLLVSARDMDSVFYIEKSTGTVLWKMGGATTSKDHAPYVRVADPFYRQHDARLQPGWSERCGRGQVSLFDDHSMANGPARGLVLDVNLGARDGGSSPDCAAGDGGPSAAVAWQYAGRSNSSSRGSFRILRDGSRVIGWGSTGMHDLVFTEVDVKGNDLRDFWFLNGAMSYRVVKVPLSAFDLGVLRRTAGGIAP